MEERSEPDGLQNSQEFSVSHNKCDKVVDYTKYQDGFKTIYIKLKYILEKEEKGASQLQKNVSFVFVLIDNVVFAFCKYFVILFCLL